MRQENVVANQIARVTIRMAEGELVRAAQRGSHEAFQRLVERYSRGVLARQFSCTRERTLAEDLAQETFVRAWRNIGRLRDEDSFAGWLFSIAGHVCMEWVRKKSTEDRHRVKLLRRAESARSRREPEPDSVLGDAVSKLPPDLQHLLSLRHGRGMSCEEIARELGKPLGTITKTLSRAYAQLRERMIRS